MAAEYTIKLSVTTEREEAIKKLFIENEWTYDGGK
jgi:hypothetical protein